jgi:D-aspartate ligase
VLAACRGLHAAGYETTVAAATRPAVTHWSRACGRRLSGLNPRPDARAFVSTIQRVLDDDPHDVILPGTDVSLLAVSEHRERLKGSACLGLPVHAAILRSLDKTLLPHAARDAGLRTPATIVCASVEEGFEALRELGAPALVKPERTVVGINGARQERAGVVVTNPRELASAVELVGPLFLVQHVEQHAVTYSFAGVAIDGHLRAQVFSRYLRTWPAEGGAASLSVTLDPPPGLAERIAALVRTLGWEGIFELELLGLPRGGFAAIDFNPRVYGSMAAAIAAGANLPGLWCDFLLGRDPARVVVARAGIFYRREDTELRHILRALRGHHLVDAVRVLAPRRAAVHAFFLPNDPGPLFAQAGTLARRISVRTMRKLA